MIFQSELMIKDKQKSHKNNKNSDKPRQKYE